MMDHNRTRAEVERRKAEILERQQQIPQEIKTLSEEMEFNKRQLIGIEQILDGLSFMDSDTPYVPESFGLTDSVRQILSDTTVPLVPTQIRDALEAKGTTGSSSKNLLINVHKVLERIDQELEKTTTPEGKTAYKRTTPWMANSLARLYGRAIPIPEYNAPRTLADLASTAAPVPESGIANHPLRKLRARPRRNPGFYKE
jgi:hypothetical protein